MDGEFPAAIAILEDNLKETRQYSHGDSVFIFKHLGVMYAAQYDTREKGKYYMHRLLMVEPTAKITNMYASDMIYMIFKNIQEEYEQNRTQLGTVHAEKTSRDTVISSSPSKSASASTGRHEGEEKESSGSGRIWVWVGVASATAIVGTVAFLLVSESSPKTTQVEKKF
jgi:hypothetical protein